MREPQVPIGKPHRQCPNRRGEGASHGSRDTGLIGGDSGIGHNRLRLMVWNMCFWDRTMASRFMGPPGSSLFLGCGQWMLLGGSQYRWVIIDVAWWSSMSLDSRLHCCTVHVDEWLPLPLTGFGVDGFNCSSIRCIYVIW